MEESWYIVLESLVVGARCRWQRIDGLSDHLFVSKIHDSHILPIGTPQSEQELIGACESWLSRRNLSRCHRVCRRHS